MLFVTIVSVNLRTQIGKVPNKRIGYVLMRYYLLENNIDIKAAQSEKFDFVMKIAKGQSSTNEICSWLKEKSVKS